MYNSEENTSPSKLIRRASFRERQSSSRPRVEVGTVYGSMRSQAEATEEVIATTAERRIVRIAFHEFGRWYLFTSDLVLLLVLACLFSPSVVASPLALSLTGRPGGGSSRADERRSPRQTMHVSAMLCGGGRGVCGGV